MVIVLYSEIRKRPALLMAMARGITIINQLAIICFCTATNQLIYDGLANEPLQFCRLTCATQTPLYALTSVNKAITRSKHVTYMIRCLCLACAKCHSLTRGILDHQRYQ